MAEPERTDVLVIGAGMSGTAAASMLATAGRSVRILEARNRVGGRLYSVREEGQDLPAELGGEFVQGRIPALLDLARAAGLLTTELVGERWIIRGGQVTQQAEHVRRAGAIFGRLPAAPAVEDCSFDEFLARDFPERRFHAARELAMDRVMGYDAARPDRIGIGFLAREQAAEAHIEGDHSFRVLSGYDRLPQWLCTSAIDRGAVLHLQTEVVEVAWRAGEVEVVARDSLSGRDAGPFRARRLVITLPVGVLKAGSVRFSPAIDTHAAGLEGVEMGSVAKVVLRFHERFWDAARPRAGGAGGAASLARAGFLGTPGQIFRTFWTAYPAQTPVLNAWCGGPPAEVLSSLPDLAVVDRALESLSASFAIPRPEIDDLLASWQFHNWQRDPFARGAYSYVVAGGIPAQHRLVETISDTIYMAGEAADLHGFQATVHGAMDVGQDAARAILAAQADNGAAKLISPGRKPDSEAKASPCPTIEREAHWLKAGWRNTMASAHEVATLGGGCFWCLDAVYRELRGVESVVSGYAGGHKPNPSYYEVCDGTTGHAEVVQITFDPTAVPYRDLLDVFFSIHDPTTLNRQGSDSGTQYRSMILCHSPEQQKMAQQAIAEVAAAGIWRGPLVTTVEPLTTFYPAEEYHQNYFVRNPNQGYCQAIISPKVAKFRKQHLGRLSTTLTH